MNLNFVSIIVPVRNERAFISKAINSILEQDYNKDLLEIFLIDGLSTDGTTEIINSYTQKYGFIKLLTNHNKTVPYALNLGIKEAKGDIIIRLDVHAEYPKNYISTLVHYLTKLNADNVGASVITLPANSSLKAKSIAIALSSRFGVGNATFRLDNNKSVEYIEVDTVPFGCYRREIFERIGLFDEQLTRNQDNEFNERLRKTGGKIYLIPSLKIKYYARENYSKLFKMFYQYGYFGPLVDIKLGRPTRLRRYIPTIFVLALFFLPFGGLIFMPLLYLWIFVIVIYTISSLLFATFKCFTRNSLKLIPYVMWAYFVSHVSYGLGYIKGFIDFPVRKVHTRNKVEVELSR
ncbi:MAG: glycosyltransferase family 2 protein [Tenuifilum sp.]|uniref:glycosyltransferase family 2 protein n=1 Tax=Tenuifilum sp. TaxID=2760880 RepID=UPI0030A16BE6